MFDPDLREPEVTVTVGEAAVPLIVTVELGATVAVWPLLRVTVTAVLPVVMVSPATSGWDGTPGVLTVLPSRVKAEVLVTDATLWENAEKAKRDEKIANANSRFVIQDSPSCTIRKYTR